ncbi:MAG: hypothetical protein JXA11_00310 [Phycisphaerae bacterium]|nr:hypothetical protein [Phycisphaerae bacterium]
MIWVDGGMGKRSSLDFENPLPDLMESHGFAGRHEGMVNFAFADGHVSPEDPGCIFETLFP